MRTKMTLMQATSFSETKLTMIFCAFVVLDCHFLQYSRQSLNRQVMSGNRQLSRDYYIKKGRFSNFIKASVVFP